MRVMYAREYQNSISDSSYKDLCAEIDNLGLAHEFDIGRIVIRHKGTGSEIFFKGLHHNAAEIKSTSGVDLCVVEEAESVSEESWEVLENPYFPEVLRKQMEHCQATDLDKFKHVWLGEPKMVSDAQVLRGRCVVKPFEPLPEFSGPYYGADWGFSVDPTALVKCWIHGRTLYVEYEAYGVGVDIDDTPQLFNSVPGSRDHAVRADCARPETISYMQRHGYPKVVGVDKWPGSVDDGVEHMRSYEQVVIHPRCKNAANEATLWSYKTDRLSGDVFPVLLDKNNHVMDAIRYAITPLIKRRVAKVSTLKL
jgi:phage terminase large subunit